MSTPIYIFCLAGMRTGGPEALHQLSDALIERGFDARMVYYTRAEIAALEASPTQAGYRFGARANTIADYAHYKTVPACDVPNDESVIVVLPETLCHLTPRFLSANVLLWWLSVDNGFGALGRVKVSYLRLENVFHAAQSAYADQVVRALQFNCCGALTDYIRVPEGPRAPLPERPMLAAVGGAAHKTITDARHIIERVKRAAPQIECVRVEGMTQAEVHALFSRARLYVDLSCQPGMDRAPREAVALGCPAMVMAEGAGLERCFARLPKAGQGDADWIASRLIDRVNDPRPTPLAFNPPNDRIKFFAEAEQCLTTILASVQQQKMKSPVG